LRLSPPSRRRKRTQPVAGDWLRRLGWALGIVCLNISPALAAQRPVVLNVRQALEIALLNQQGITGARAAIASARAQRLGALANFLPSLSLTDQPQHYHPLEQSSSTFIAGTLVPAPHAFFNNSASANFNLNLYAGGKDVAGYRAALAGVRSAKAGLSAAMNETFLQVLSAYEALAKDETTIAAQQRIVRIAQEISRLTEARFKRRMASDIDWIQAQQQALQAETQFSQNRQQAAADRQQLLRAMGYVAPLTGWEIQQRLPPSPSLPPGTFRPGLDPAVRAADAQLQAAHDQVAAARAGYWPSVALTGQYNALGVDPNAMGHAVTATHGRGYSVGFSVTVPLLPFFNTESAVETAQAQVESALGADRNARVIAASRSEPARLLYLEAQHSARLARRSAALACTNTRLTAARYQARQSSRIDLDKARLLAAQAALAANTTRFDRRLAAWRLYRAMHPGRFAHTLWRAARGKKRSPPRQRPQ